MSKIAIWTFATPMNSHGQMFDNLQGGYAMGISRALAEGFQRSGLCQPILCLPVVNIQGQPGWAISGSEFTQDEIEKIKFIEDVEIFIGGSCAIIEKAHVHISLTNLNTKNIVYDNVHRFSRYKFFKLLNKIICAIIKVIRNEDVTKEQFAKISDWGTSNVDAYLNYLEGWRAFAGRRAKLLIIRPDQTFEGFRKAIEIDPDFDLAKEGFRKLAEFLNYPLQKTEIDFNVDKSKIKRNIPCEIIEYIYKVNPKYV